MLNSVVCPEIQRLVACDSLQPAAARKDGFVVGYPGVAAEDRKAGMGKRFAWVPDFRLCTLRSLRHGPAATDYDPVGV